MPVLGDDQCLALVAAILATAKDPPATYLDLVERAHTLMATARDVHAARADVRKAADAERARWWTVRALREYLEEMERLGNADAPVIWQSLSHTWAVDPILTTRNGVPVILVNR